MSADAIRAAGSPGNALPLPAHSSYQKGEAVNSLYEWSTEKEMETALRGWLLQTISALEQEAQARAKSA